MTFDLSFSPKQHIRRSGKKTKTILQFLSISRATRIEKSSDDLG